MITIIPAIEFKSPKNWVTELDKILLIKTPRVEKTTENPNTKNIVLAMILTLLIWKLFFWLCFISFNVVPEIYAKKAGIIGKIHGAIKDPNPAENAINIVGSAMYWIHYFYFKALLQILAVSNTLLFI